MFIYTVLNRVEFVDRVGFKFLFSGASKIAVQKCNLDILKAVIFQYDTF